MDDTVDGTGLMATGYPGLTQPQDTGPQQPVQPGGNTTAEGVTAIGGAGSAISQMLAGREAAQVAESNAKVKQLEASMALADGNRAAVAAAMRGRAMAARAAAGQAGGGTIAGAGTGGMVQAADENAGALDAVMIRRNAARMALGLDIAAGNEHVRGRMSEAQGYSGASSTLLNTTGQEWLESDPNYTGFRSGGIQFGRG